MKVYLSKQIEFVRHGDEFIEAGENVIHFVPETKDDRDTLIDFAQQHARVK